VRLEVAAALKRNIRVIPVLVQEASMPDEDQLPDELKRLSKRQASEMSDNRWEFDTEQLVKVLEKAGVKTKPGQSPVRDAFAAPPAKAETKLGWKVIASLVLSILLLFAFAEERDTESNVGGMVIGLIALVLGILAFYDAKLNPALRGTRGKALAITGMSLSGLVTLAFIGSMTDSHQSAAPPIEPPALGEATQQPAPQPLVSAPVPPPPVAPAPAPINVNGTWRAQDGVYVFQQSGNNITVHVFNWNQVLLAQGTGTITQGVVTLAYARIDNTGGEARLQVSADGTQMAGTYRNHVTGEAGAMVLVR
jgi:hypothetical protein